MTGVSVAEAEGGFHAVGSHELLTRHDHSPVRLSVIPLIPDVQHAAVPVRTPH
jgi:hypothetical protein